MSKSRLCDQCRRAIVHGDRIVRYAFPGLKVRGKQVPIAWLHARCVGRALLRVTREHISLRKRGRIVPV